MFEQLAPAIACVVAHGDLTLQAKAENAAGLDNCILKDLRNKRDGVANSIIDVP